MSTPAPPGLDRRRFLGAAGLGVLGSSLLGSLIARAQMGPPKRFLLAMRPHGSVASGFFPQGGNATDFQLPSISAGFEPVKSEMVLFRRLTNPRRESWPGEHEAGLWGMTTGKNGVRDGSLVGAGISIDQWLAQDSPLTAGTLKRSIQLAGAADSGAGGGLGAGLRVLSYAAGGGAAGVMNPETRPDVAASGLFANVMPGGGGADDAAQVRAKELSRAVLDQLTRDASRLKARAPVSEHPKLDEHLSAIADLVRQNDTVPAGGQGCSVPSISPTPEGDLGHSELSRQMFRIIRGAFACDLTRVASFTFAPEQSPIPFHRILPNEVRNSDGHHDVSHAADEAERGAIDKYYCSLFAELLLDLKNTPDGPGTTLLDNTVVVFITAINDGNEHGMENMPVALFGGKSLGVAGGRIMDLNGRYMNDVWSALGQAFGLSGNFGDPALGSGPVSGLFA